MDYLPVNERQRFSFSLIGPLPTQAYGGGQMSRLRSWLGNLAARAPDFLAVDFFQCYYLKSKVYKAIPGGIRVLEQRI